jgi:hypothetical protein
MSLFRILAFGVGADFVLNGVSQIPGLGQITQPLASSVNSTTGSTASAASGIVSILSSPDILLLGGAVVLIFLLR